MRPLYSLHDFPVSDPYEPTAVTLKRYGITRVQYNALFKKQGGACAICEETLYAPHIDHDHKTGKVRGLLCVSCNTKLVFALESPHLKAARAYLRKHV
jgi:hypothetical protein